MKSREDKLTCFTTDLNGRVINNTLLVMISKNESKLARNGQLVYNGK